MTYSEVQKIAKTTIEYIKTIVMPNMNLQEVRKLCEDKMFELGADSFWYWDIGAFVFSGNGTTVSLSGRDYVTPDKKIAENDIITIDLSPQNNKIWGDYARTIIIEKGKVVNDVESIQNTEWRNGLFMEEALHNELKAFATPDTSFEELYYHINELIKSKGYINLDFLGNLGHSIVKDKNERIYIEKGNTKMLSEVKYFIFEPHIWTEGSMYGFKKENIYYFKDSKLVEL
ncbi:MULTISPECIES: M24 family metallopeptidase [unclassified Ruminococcus]|uniref:M24 family metallopeptidase n=1 Tax=unclassified Ruminococcus TaxID=2608920 RepID=UPI00210D65B2|nr:MULTISPECIES: M24 family metallopeptidase [unclassified Ruminococcus]MCQ4022344.1 M24 family metallopeptidase [Ruminococcus sp. zg-924]MCQ4114672.1 M24 family metallopeptidase [Ruminococcus sp. zg-921]